MKPTERSLGPAALVCLALAGCGGLSPITINDVLTEPAEGQTGVVNPPDQQADDQSGDPSVGDVLTEDPLPGSPFTPPIPSGAMTSARVRNESEARADVTVRFIRDEMIVHLAFVRVLPRTITMVASPEAADLVALSGVDENGRALDARTLALGIDFDETTPAEYVIEGADPTVDRPPPGDTSPATVTLLEPQSDTSLALGSSLIVRWEDDATAPGTWVFVFLRPVGAADPDDWIPVGPAVGAALDGINDQLRIVLQDLEPGVYEVVAQIDDGVGLSTSVAPGLVDVVTHPGNAAPTLSILSPSDLVALRNGDALTIRWEDADPDDNATITFSLVGMEGQTEIGVGTFPIGPALAEDPDGAAADAATLRIEDLLPGRYALVGTIDDGELIGTARVEDAVRILPEPENDPPQLELTEPSREVVVDAGGSFFVRWSDSDTNDNARISLLLDPDLNRIALDGNEILLVASLGENEDGAGDEITLGLPAGTGLGTYEVVGVITDGLTEVITRAPGTVRVMSTDNVSDGDGGGGGGGDDTPLQRAIEMTEPSGDEMTRVGDEVTVHIETTNVPADADVRIYLSNQPFGGQMRVDVTPDGFVAATDVALALPSGPAGIGNETWPRQFRLETEVVVEGETLSAVAPGLVWIRQEVEVVAVEMVNYWCTSQEAATLDETPFTGVKITWRGGGFGSGQEVLRPVRFSLSKDQILPGNDEDDAWHRMMYDGDIENPGPTTNVTSIEIGQAIGIGIVWDEGLEFGQLGIPLEAGSYYIMAAVNSNLFGRIVTPAHPDPIEVCYPLPSPSSGE